MKITSIDFDARELTRNFVKAIYALAVKNVKSSDYPQNLEDPKLELTRILDSIDLPYKDFFEMEAGNQEVMSYHVTRLCDQHPVTMGFLLTGQVQDPKNSEPIEVALHD